MIKSALQSSLTNDVKYSSMSAGNLPSNEYLIETVVVGSTSVPSVQFTNLSQFAGIYKDLRIVAVSRTSRACCNNDTTGIRLNGDSGNNYSGHWLMKESSSIFGSGNMVSGNHIFTGYSAAAATAGANEFGFYEATILDAFSTTKNKTVKIEFGFMSSGSATVVGIAGGCWLNQAAVSSISFHPIHGPGTWNITEHSRFSLYGVTA